MIDPQAKRPDEEAKHHLAYLCYRDLGMNRDIPAAYMKYLERQGKAKLSRGKPKHASAAFKGWAKLFDWDDRCHDWDMKEEERRRHATIEAQGEKWLQETQTYQENLYAIGLAGMIFVNDWLVISRHIIRPVADRVRMNPDVPLSKEDKDVFYKAGKPAEVMAIADKASMLVAESKNLKEFLSDYQSGDRT